MKNRIIFTVVAFLFISSLNAQTNSQLVFEKISYEKAIQKAKTTNKLVYVYYTDSVCISCKNMELTVFKNLESFDFYNNNFINIKIYDNSSMNKNLKKKFNLNNIPTHLFINANQELVHKAIGPMDNMEFVELAHISSDNTNNLLALKNEFNTLGVKMSQDRKLKYINTLYKASEDYSVVAKQYFELLTEDDFNKPEILKLVYDLSKDVYSREFKMLLKKSDYVYFGISKEDILFHISDVLAQHTLKASKNKPGISFKDSLIALCSMLEFPFDGMVANWSEILYAKEFSKDRTGYYTLLSQFVDANLSTLPVTKKLDFAMEIVENSKDQRLKEETIRWLQFTFEQVQDPKILVTLSYTLFVIGRIEESNAMMESAELFAKERGIDISNEISSYKAKMNVKK